MHPSYPHFGVIAGINPTKAQKAEDDEDPGSTISFPENSLDQLNKVRKQQSHVASAAVASAAVASAAVASAAVASAAAAAPERSVNWLYSLCKSLGSCERLNEIFW